MDIMDWIIAIVAGCLLIYGLHTLRKANKVLNESRTLLARYKEEIDEAQDQ